MFTQSVSRHPRGRAAYVALGGFARFVYLRSAAMTTGQTPLARSPGLTIKTSPLDLVGSNFRVTTLLFNLAPGALLARRSTPSAWRRVGSDYRHAFGVSFQGVAQAFQLACGCRRRSGLVIAPCRSVLGLTRATSIRSRSLDASLRGSGRPPGAELRGDLGELIGVIGIILLIGIVQKNAIMMIDFALEAERKDGLPSRGDLSRLLLRSPILTTMRLRCSLFPVLGTGSAPNSQAARHYDSPAVLLQPAADFVRRRSSISFSELAARFGMSCRRSRAGAETRRTSAFLSFHLPAHRDPLRRSRIVSPGSWAIRTSGFALLQVEYPTIIVKPACRGRARTRWRLPLQRRWNVIWAIAGISEMTSGSNLDPRRSRFSSV